tara:strand:+ start:83 stop:409 length:327 start_codon:yes stop_codon:yes gene_type:complete
VTKEEVLNQILKLSDESKTATEIGAILGLTKNAVMGRIYRHKTKNGYVPAPTSRYAFIRKYRKHKSNMVVIGISKCTMCYRDYEAHSKYERFCNSCRKNINSKTSWML